MVQTGIHNSKQINPLEEKNRISKCKISLHDPVPMMGDHIHLI